MIARGNLTLIDARYPADYAAGHLPEAISIPLDMSADRRSQLLDDVSRGDPVVIYCQSETCPYSAVIAHRLLNSGFYNVSIYREGWTGWKRQIATRRRFPGKRRPQPSAMVVSGHMATPRHSRALFTRGCRIKNTTSCRIFGSC
jgi:rhodanese-related sulfurtransferase